LKALLATKTISPIAKINWQPITKTSAPVFTTPLIAKLTQENIQITAAIAIPFLRLVFSSFLTNPQLQKCD